MGGWEGGGGATTITSLWAELYHHTQGRWVFGLGLPVTVSVSVVRLEGLLRFSRLLSLQRDRGEEGRDRQTDGQTDRNIDKEERERV